MTGPEPRLVPPDPIGQLLDLLLIVVGRDPAQLAEGVEVEAQGERLLLFQLPFLQT